MMLTIPWPSVPVADAAWVILGAYLLGCFNTGYYLVKLRQKTDIRNLGSCNAGARNVGRFLGWQGFVLTLIGDVVKGIIAVWVARHFVPRDGVVVLAALAVVVGHIWPVQLRFHGGKGMAASIGALWGLDPHLVAALGLSFAMLWCCFRNTTFSGLIGLCLVPVISFYLGNSPATNCGLATLAVLVVIAHRKNIVKELSTFTQSRKVDESHPHTKS